MTQSLMCDVCGNTARTEGLIGWFVVEQAGIKTLRYDLTAGPWHVCSWDCLTTLGSLEGRPPT